MRVVSLVPSVSETLVALGVVPVACTRYCELAGVPVVGGTKNVDVDAVVALAPDLVVVNDEENRLEDARALEARDLRLHSMSPRSLADVGPAVRALAELVGVAVPTPFDDWESWMHGSRHAAHVRAFVAIWRRPYMTINRDTYGASLLAHLGVVNVFDDAPDRYPEVTLADVARRHPSAALLPSEPYAFGERHIAEVAAALPDARVTLVDGRDLFWWGIRTPAAATRLAEVA